MICFVSDHAEIAEDLLSRVSNVDEDGSQQIPYLFVSAIVHALLDVADALRSKEVGRDGD